MVPTLWKDYGINRHIAAVSCNSNIGTSTTLVFWGIFQNPDGKKVRQSLLTIGHAYFDENFQCVTVFRWHRPGLAPTGMLLKMPTHAHKFEKAIVPLNIDFLASYWFVII